MESENFVIQEGSLTAFECLGLLASNKPAEERRKLLDGLHAHSGCDTLDLLKVREELIKRFRDEGAGLPYGISFFCQDRLDPIPQISSGF